jgi:O-antigen/teichoic acid export membrane protein
LPSFAAAHGRGSHEGLLRRYDNASRVMLFTIGAAAASLVFFGEPLLAAWVNPGAAAAAAPALALLAIGFWGSAAASNAFQVAIACGRPNLALRVSVLAAPPYFVGLYGLISAWGIEGAALAWLLLNAAYVIFLVPRVHHELLKVAVWPFVLRILAPFAMLAVLAFGLARAVVDTGSLATPIGLAALTGALLVYTVLGYFLLGNEIRNSVWTSLRLHAQTP